MKKRYINYFKAFLMTGLIVSAASCKRNIELSTTDRIDATKAFSTAADIEQATIGVYAGFSYDNSLYTAAIMSDEVRWGIDNNSRNYGSEHKWQFDSGAGNVTAAWINQYLVIDRINRILAVIDNIPNASKDRQKGELLGMRAFCHFELLRNYAQSYDANAPGVPILLQSSVLGQPARSTFAQVIAQVKTDLSAAKTLIPATFSTTDPTRITKIAISAIQARVALYEKNWNDAVTYSTEVINAVPLATRATYASIWTDASTAEQLFSVKRANSATVYVGVLWRDSNNDVFFSPSYKEIDTYSAADKTNDIRYATFIKQDLTLPAATKEQWLVVKYPGSGGNKSNNTKVLRVAEMYLIRAEAYAELTAPNLAGAYADLNALRAARLTTYTAVAPVSHDDLITQVYTERMKELFCEGHRFFDIKRRNLTITRDPRDIATGAAINQILTPTSRNYQLPIPQAEIFANPNIVQNSSYL